MIAVTDIEEQRPGNNSSQLNRRSFDTEPIVDSSDSDSDYDSEKSEKSIASLEPNVGYLVDKHGRARDPTYYFECGERVVDFVLVYKQLSTNKVTRNTAMLEWLLAKYRQRFANKLIFLGLQIEVYESTGFTDNNKFGYLKIHAPYNFLAEQAEYYRIRLPIAGVDSQLETKQTLSQFSLRRFLLGYCARSIPQEYLPRERFYYKTNFDRFRESMFLVPDDAMFQPIDRIRMVWNVIERATINRVTHRKAQKKHKTVSMKNPVLLRNRSKDDYPVGFYWLLQQNAFVDAYPIHDCSLHYPNGRDPYAGIPPKHLPQRYWLRKYWGSWRVWNFLQPLDEIFRYCGVHVGLYFAWLGMYTKWLIIPSIAGLLAILEGVYYVVKDRAFDGVFCDPDKKDDKGDPLMICRLCRSILCPYKHVSEDCQYSRMAHLSDHTGTMLYSLFMCAWAIVFVAMWKRRQLQLAIRWDAYDEEYDQPVIRANYLLNVTTKRRDPVTGRDEIFLATSVRSRRVAASAAAVFFYILLLLTFLAGILSYRALSLGILDRTSASDFKLLGVVDLSLVSSVASSFINGVTIAVLSMVYKSTAVKLTEYEYPRTEEEYNRSYCYKVFTFEFVNYYGTLFYLALFKGKQIFNNVLEVGLPWAKHQLRKIRGTNQEPRDQAARDYLLRRWSKPPLFEDYLEIVIQYGFLIMFAAAFPLAPFFAFLNNLLEIRSDSVRLVTEKRRTIPERVKNIGPWLDIISAMTKTACVTNALIIAFSTDFIDRTVYDLLLKEEIVLALEKKPELRQYDYLIFAIVDYNATDVFGTDEPELLINQNQQWNPNATNTTVNYCRYRGYVYNYRHPPGKRYTVDKTWYKVQAAKLSFVLLFLTVLKIVFMIVHRCIPTASTRVRHHIDRERVVAHEKLIEYDANPSTGAPLIVPDIP